MTTERFDVKLLIIGIYYKQLILTTEFRHKTVSDNFISYCVQYYCNADTIHGFIYDEIQ